MPARRAGRARVPRIRRQRFPAVAGADPTGDLALLTNPDRDHRRQLYWDTGDVRLSDEHGAGPRPARLNQPWLRAPGRRHGRAIDIVRRHRDLVANPAVPDI